LIARLDISGLNGLTAHMFIHTIRHERSGAKHPEKLEEYAYLDGAEIGEYVSSLLKVAQYNTNHGMTEEFELALKKELEYWLERFENETEIVTTIEPQPDRQVKELVWIDV